MFEPWVTKVIQLVEAVKAATGFGSVTIHIYKGHVVRFEHAVTEIHIMPNS